MGCLPPAPRETKLIGLFMNIQEQYFTCKKCGESKIWGKFKTSKTSIGGRCKVCIQCYNKTYNLKIELNGGLTDEQRRKKRESGIRSREKNKEKYKEKQKKYYLKNKEKICERVRKRAENMRPQLAEYGRKYYKDNSEKCTIRNKAYRAKNEESYKEWERQYRNERKDKSRDYHRVWRQENHEYVTERRMHYKDSLPTAYMITRLAKRGFTREEILQNPELINLQRTILQIKRLCKTSNN